MVLCVSDAANAEGEKGAMKFRWQRKPLGMSIDCGGRGGRGRGEGLARTRGGYVADQGARAAKMKSAPGPGTTDLGYSTTPHPTKGVRPRARHMAIAVTSARFEVQSLRSQVIRLLKLHA